MQHISSHMYCMESRLRGVRIRFRSEWGWLSSVFEMICHNTTLTHPYTVTCMFSSRLDAKQRKKPTPFRLYLRSVHKRVAWTFYKHRGDMQRHVSNCIYLEIIIRIETKTFIMLLKSVRVFVSVWLGASKRIECDCAEFQMA